MFILYLTMSVFIKAFCHHEEEQEKYIIQKKVVMDHIQSAGGNSEYKQDFKKIVACVLLTSVRKLEIPA